MKWILCALLLAFACQKDDPPKSTKSAPPPVKSSEKLVYFGGKPLVPPAGFRISLTQQPPLEHLVIENDATRCEMGILLGHSSTDDAERLKQAFAEKYKGPPLPFRRSYAGVLFVGNRIGQAHISQAKIGNDLVALALTGPGIRRCEPWIFEIIKRLAPKDLH